MPDNLPLVVPDPDALKSLENKQNLVRDLVTAVVEGFKTGLFLHGVGGMGKSFTVIDHLKSLDVSYRLFNSRMTARGLFLSLQRAPDVVHIFEDMERLTKDPDAQGVLRSALWAQPGHERVVTWTTATSGQEEFTFRGGIILIANRPLANLPELRALATRIEVHRYDASDAEIAALMRQLARQGFRVGDKVAVDAEQCGVVTEYLLAQCRSVGCPLDLRLQQKAFATAWQCNQDRARLHWKDLVANSVREASCHFRHEIDTAPPEEKQKRRRNILRQIIRQTDNEKEQERLYQEKTGKARADYFRRKREIVSREFDEFDAA